MTKIIFLHESLNCSSYSHFSTINVKTFFENGLFEPLKVEILKNFIKYIFEIQVFLVLKDQIFCAFILPSWLSKLFYNYHRPFLLSER